MPGSPELVVCPLCETPCRRQAVACDVCEQPLGEEPDIAALEVEQRIHGQRILATVAAMVGVFALTLLAFRGAAYLVLLGGGYLSTSLVRFHWATRRLQRARRPVTF